MRIRRSSSSMKIFNDRSKMFIEVLKSSGFREELTYQEPKMPNENNFYMIKENTKSNNKGISQKNGKRKIIWVCAAFCKLVNMNIGKYFLKSIDKRFNQNNILHKIINRKTLKISSLARKNPLK